MKTTYNFFSIIALIIVIIGALNWFSVGIFGFNFVDWITGSISWIARVVYILVGIAGVYMIVWLSVARCRMAETGVTEPKRKITK